VADAVIVLAAFLLAHLLRFQSGLIPAPLGRIELSAWLALALLVLPAWLLISALHGLYYSRLKQPFAIELAGLTHASAEGLIAAVLLTFAFRGLPDSRLALLLAVAFAWILLASYRALARRLRRARPLAAVLGTSPLADYLRRQLARGGASFELAAAHGSAREFDCSGVDVVFCDVDQAGELWPRLPSQPCAVAVYLLPQAGATGQAALSAATVEGVPTLSVKSAHDLAVMRQVKRTADTACAVVLLVLTSPLWLLCLAGIGLTMPGPLFFAHKRVGLSGKSVRLLKFRSMKAGQPEAEAPAGFEERFKLKDDPRVTAFGRFMRRFSLDELPQLVNVLRGELSLVGPRPVVAEEQAKYGVWAGLLTTVPPGLTGMWQVSGRSDLSYQQRVDLDLYYINNWSPGLDLLVLLRTIPAVLSRRGAY